MKKELKDTIIAELGEKLKAYPHFYLVDLAGLNAEKTSELRRKCFKSEIKLLGRWAALPLKDTFSAEIAVGEAVSYLACLTFRLTIAVTARLRWFPAQRGRPSASRSILSQSPGNERRR